MLRSLRDLAEGRRGLLRKNLQAKRVDYSARSVVVPGPELNLHQCGLPMRIALELFRPLVVQRLVGQGHADSIEAAQRLLDRPQSQGRDALADVSRNYPVLLSRPRGTRPAMLAFEPVLIEGHAIRIHPLVSREFGVEFGGEQVVVHLPLSLDAQAEAAAVLMPPRPFFIAADGMPKFSPAQDILLGCYYLTLALPQRKGEGMTFGSAAEVEQAWSLGKVDTHARIKLRLPWDGWVRDPWYGPLRSVRVRDRAPGSMIETTVGRALLNLLLPAGMLYYNDELRSEVLDALLADCRDLLGQRATIAILEDLGRLGCRAATRSGLSLATVDLLLPPGKPRFLAAAEVGVAKLRRLYERGIICEGERYRQTIDAWTDACNQINTELYAALEDDRRYPGYVNPLHAMARCGTLADRRGIQQICGMHSPSLKSWDQAFETPTRANFREGLSVLEYFRSTIGARSRLSEQALKPADRRYFDELDEGWACKTPNARDLTRKLAGAAGHVVVTMHDCGTTDGVTKAPVWNEYGEEFLLSLSPLVNCTIPTIRWGPCDHREVSLRSISELVRGRVACKTLVDPADGTLMVAANELITPAQAERIEARGIDRLLVRSPVTCRAPSGVCRLCYGVDPSTGSLVEEGAAVGIVAAQCIGELGNALITHTFHIGGFAARDGDESEIRVRREGFASFNRLKAACNDAGERVAANSRGEIIVVDAQGREFERHEIPHGAKLLVEEGQPVASGTSLCRWDPHGCPILAGVGGTVRYEDIIDGRTTRQEWDAGGVVIDDRGKFHLAGVIIDAPRRGLVVIDHRGEFHPRILLEDEHGRIAASHFLPEKAQIEVWAGQVVSASTTIATVPRFLNEFDLDFVGGLPRLTEIFEARMPTDPAVLAEVDGYVELLPEKRFGKRIIVVRGPSGIEYEHLVHDDKYRRVYTGAFVRAGEALTDGPLPLRDVLRISGLEVVRQRMLRSVQCLFRADRIDIDDKHVEVILAQMLRRVRVQASGDTLLLPGMLIDRVSLQTVNDGLERCAKILDAGDSDFTAGQIVAAEALEEEQARLKVAGRTPPTWIRPVPVVGVPQLLGISQLGAMRESFIAAAATTQDVAKVLADAALAGRVDPLAGPKENVILGRLVPVGTGFRE